MDELKLSASEGPIGIVNATDIGCDAIFVSTSKVKGIALPEINSSQASPFFQQKPGRYRRVDHEQRRNYKRDLKLIPEGLSSRKRRCFG